MLFELGFTAEFLCFCGGMAGGQLNRPIAGMHISVETETAYAKRFHFRWKNQ